MWILHPAFDQLEPKPLDFTCKLYVYQQNPGHIDPKDDDSVGGLGLDTRPPPSPGRPGRGTMAWQQPSTFGGRNPSPYWNISYQQTKFSDL